MCGFTQLATLQFERKLQKCIKIGKTIFKIGFGEVYRWIYGLNHVLRLCLRIAVKILISDCISDDIPPQMKTLNTVIP